MATQKSTQAAPAASVKSSTTTDEISKLRESINEADSLCQIAERSISAATASILLMLFEPDSSGRRLHIKALCEIIDYHAFSCMNSVNVEAEKHDANYKGPDRQVDARICAAARGVVSNGQAVQS